MVFILGVFCDNRVELAIVCLLWVVGVFWGWGWLVGFGVFLGGQVSWQARIFLRTITGILISHSISTGVLLHDKKQEIGY